MEYAVLGRAEEGPQLRLDYREFSYAGKFVMSNTGKAVVRDPDAESGESVETGEATDPNPDLDRDWIADDRIVAAVAFNEDRTDPATAWLRYVTVRRDRRGAGLGARLARFATARLRDREYERVKIAVNNPFAYHALYKAGFGYTGEQTGIAELVLARPGERSPERYRTGLDAYRERENLESEERAFLSANVGSDPPDVVPVPE
jgi:predicted N-acetyltransferase YhbS